MSDAPSTRLIELASRVPLAWRLVAPALAVDTLTLLFARRLWSNVITSVSRSGRVSHSIEAHMHLGVIAACLAAYFGIAFFREHLGLRGRFGALASEGDSTVVEALVRGACVVGLYLHAIVMVHSAVTG